MGVQLLCMTWMGDLWQDYLESSEWLKSYKVLNLILSCAWERRGRLVPGLLHKAKGLIQWDEGESLIENETVFMSDEWES